MSKTQKVHNFSRFSIGDYVVLPSNGLGKLVDVETKTIMDMEIKTYKIHFQIEDMDVFVPFERLEESGLRKIVSKDMIDKVFEIISKQPKNYRGVWNKKIQEYDAKIFSGSLLLTAEVLRDIFACAIDPNKSYTERTRYKMALTRVVSEVAIVSGISNEEAEKKVIATLKSVQCKKDQSEDEFDSFEEFLRKEGQESSDDEDEKEEAEG